MDINSALADWRQLLGEQSVISSAQASLAYGFETTGAVRSIAGALKIREPVHEPNRPDAALSLMAEVVRIAQRYSVPIYPISTGRNWGYGTALPVHDDCVIVDLSDFQTILHFDPDLGVVTVGPGVTQQMLADFLDAGNHPFLVPVTGAGPHVSLLANALERGYGVTPITDHFSAVTDLEAVLPDGTIYKTALREAGGEELARLFKWGVGYYSAGLFTQSGFGIVTRMSIVLARRPECVKVCLFSLKHDSLLEPAVERIRSILSRLQGTVGAINLMNQHRVLAMAAPYPAAKIGADGLIPDAEIAELGGQYQIFPWTGFGTLYGTPALVAAAQKEIRRTVSSIASRLIFLTPQRASTLAALAGKLPGAMGARLAKTAGTLAQSLELVAGRPNETALPLAYWRNKRTPGVEPRNPSADGCGLIWYAPLVPMRPANVRTYTEMVKRVTRRKRIEPLITFTTLNDRLFDSTVPIVFDRDDAQGVQLANECYHDLIAAGRPHGFFPYRMGVSGMTDLLALQKESLSFHRRLQAAFDPADIMAPGRYR